MVVIVPEDVSSLSFTGIAGNYQRGMLGSAGMSPLVLVDLRIVRSGREYQKRHINHDQSLSKHQTQPALFALIQRIKKSAFTPMFQIKKIKKGRKPTLTIYKL